MYGCVLVSVIESIRDDADIKELSKQLTRVERRIVSVCV